MVADRDLAILGQAYHNIPFFQKVVSGKAGPLGQNSRMTLLALIASLVALVTATAKEQGNKSLHSNQVATVSK